MDKEKQRIKIAEACGWRLFSQFKNLWAPPRHVVEYDCDAYPLPDYLNDLNAMHNALAYLTPEQLEQWSVNLTAIILENNSGAWWDLNISETAQVLSATAEQWAEAFLKTLNLWEE